MTLNTSLQFREVNRFDRSLFRMVRWARRIVEWADGKVHTCEVALRRDFSQRREESEARPRTPTPRSFAVVPELERGAAQQICTDQVTKRAVRRQRQPRHITAADFDSRYSD